MQLYNVPQQTVKKWAPHQMAHAQGTPVRPREAQPLQKQVGVQKPDRHGDQCSQSMLRSVLHIVTGILHEFCVAGG